MVRRLDATAACGISDGVAEAEAITLRLLVNVSCIGCHLTRLKIFMHKLCMQIAWQKIQESVNKN